MLDTSIVTTNKKVVHFNIRFNDRNLTTYVYNFTISYRESYRLVEFI